MNGSDMYLQYEASKTGQHGVSRVFVKVPRTAITEYRRVYDNEACDEDVAEKLSRLITFSGVLKSHWLHNLEFLPGSPAEIQKERDSFKCRGLTFWVTNGLLRRSQPPCCATSRRKPSGRRATSLKLPRAEQPQPSPPGPRSER